MVALGECAYEALGILVSVYVGVQVGDDKQKQWVMCQA